MPHVCGRRHRQSIRAGTCALSNAVYSLSVQGGAVVRSTRDARPQAELACGAGADAGGPAPPVPSRLRLRGPLLAAAPASFCPSQRRRPARVGPVAPSSGLPLERPFSLPHPGTCCSGCSQGPVLGGTRGLLQSRGGCVDNLRGWSGGRQCGSAGWAWSGSAAPAGSPLPSAAPGSHVPGRFEALPCGRRGAARHGKPAPGGGRGWWERCFALTPGVPCALAPTVLWAACTAAEHL